ncbi:hypothetical protein CDD81_965 [Ophiocordyceps australis]|uniref:BTB domain-containing protein n=1 Tax=Ophiocordyceps australis TaxID=1399860 RepID=A0A2C5X8B5_9HYPO|nr:hypothetical protein CDD81_965 [Ophiocordyceps australis]
MKEWVSRDRDRGTLYNICGEGDVILVLRNPNAPFAVWEGDGSRAGKRGEGMRRSKEKRQRETKGWVEERAKEEEGGEEEPDAAPAQPAEGKIASKALTALRFRAAFLKASINSGGGGGQQAHGEASMDSTPAGDSIFGSAGANAGYQVDDDSGDTATGSQSERRSSTCLPWGDEQVVRFRLSSECLLSRSKYFFNMFNGPWQENGSDTTLRIIYAHEWKEEALAIVMCALHGWTAPIPRDIDTELFAQIAVIVDYYQCHAAMTQFAARWLSKLKRKLPKHYGRKMVLVLLILQVFGASDAFWDLSIRVQRQVDGPLMLLGLPFAPRLQGSVPPQPATSNPWPRRRLMPSHPQDRLETARQRNVGALITYIYDSLACLSRNHSGCEEATCCASRVRQLVQQLVATQIFPKPDPPYHGFSMAYILDKVLRLDEPAWYTRCFMGRMLRAQTPLRPLPAGDDKSMRRARESYIERLRLEEELLETIRWSRVERGRHVHCRRAWHTAPGVEGLDMAIEGMALAPGGDDGFEEWCEVFAARGG